MDAGGLPLPEAVVAPRFQVGESLLPHFFRLRNLIFQLTNIGMTIGVVGAEIGELRSEFVQLLIQSGYSYRCAVPALRSFSAKYGIVPASIASRRSAADRR